ncbi:MAG TPA: hypothetical protein VFT13_07460 [Candidatus Krumholzibacteria bacterium]|nr:hypothetical protein [Candidatus Krumholzibacteria bacterium]
MPTATVLFFCCGLALLIAGGELLVRGASRLARSLGVTELVVGLTVVAFGTSSPELVVSILAASAGKSEIAVGNVVGSNIFNILFILGLAALMRPLIVARTIVRRDIPIMIGASLLLWLFAADRVISKPEAVAFVIGIVAFTCFTVATSPSATSSGATSSISCRFWVLRRCSAATDSAWRRRSKTSTFP